jgi:hypothetical protein
MKASARFAVAALSLAALAAGGTGCTGPTARVKGDDEGTLVDVRRGGTETYKDLIRKGVNEILDEQGARLAGAAEKVSVAYVGVENKSSEELGEFRAAIDQEVGTALVNSRMFVNVSNRLVEAAKREANIRDAADLVVSRHREAFMGVLNRDGLTPQYFLFGTVTSMTSRGSREKERTYQLTFEMMDSSSGQTVTQKTVEVRKAYED